MIYADRLEAALARSGTPCVLGLDPHLDLLPPDFALARDPAATRAERARAVGDFLCELIDVACERIAVVKPQSAFFELLGADGAAAWERVVAHAHGAGLLVIGDVKRGDIASTAAAYAAAYLEGLEGAPGGPRAHVCDAITVNAFLGHDSLEPFLAACRRSGGGLYVLVRTSNPGSADFQLHGRPTLSEKLADAVAHWGRELTGACGLSSVGAVVGATQPEVLRDLRARMPRTPFLLPGFGAQGGGPADVVAAFLPGGRGALVSSSRAVAFAHARPEHAGLHWKDAAARALDEMIAGLRAALAAGR